MEAPRGKVKRKPSAYNIYMKQKYWEEKKKNKDFTFPQALKQFGPLWKKMSDANKKKYK